MVNSADIVSYLEHRYPDRPVYPEMPGTRVHARAWERAADTYIDPILVDISYWKWADRPDPMPDGLLAAARADLALVYDALEGELSKREYVSGSLSIADIALFPHIASARAMEVAFSQERHRNLTRWFKRIRSLPIGIGRSKARPRLRCQPWRERCREDIRSSGVATVLNGCWHAASTSGSSMKYESGGSSGRAQQSRHL